MVPSWIASLFSHKSTGFRQILSLCSWKYSSTLYGRKRNRHHLTLIRLIWILLNPTKTSYFTSYRQDDRCDTTGKKILKKFPGVKRDSNPGPLRFWCNALTPNWAIKVTREVVCVFGPLCSADVILGLSMAVFASIIYDRYCWTSITIEFTYMNRVLRPLKIKGQTHTGLLSCNKLRGENCIGNSTVFGSNTIQSLQNFSFFFFQ